MFSILSRSFRAFYAARTYFQNRANRRAAAKAAKAAKKARWAPADGFSRAAPGRRPAHVATVAASPVARPSLRRAAAAATPPASASNLGRMAVESARNGLQSHPILMSTPEAKAKGWAQSIVNRGKSWAGMLEATLAARVYGLDLTIYRRSSQNPEVGIYHSSRHWNAGNGKVIKLAYSGNHYDPLEEVVDFSAPGVDGERKVLMLDPKQAIGDGSCFYYSLAEAMDLPHVRQITTAFRNGTMAQLRRDPDVMQLLPRDARRGTNVEIYHALMATFDRQLRHDLARAALQPANRDIVAMIADDDNLMQ